MTEQYEFVGGFPTAETVQRAYDEADLNRAVQCYRLFFPTVSGLAIFKGNEAVGLVDNEVHVGTAGLSTNILMRCASAPTDRERVRG